RRGNIRSQPSRRWLEEHTVASRLDADAQGVARHEVRLRLEQDRLRNLQRTALAPLLKRDTDVQAVGPRRLGEMGLQTVRYPPRQLAQQSALRRRDVFEVHARLPQLRRPARPPVPNAFLLTFTPWPRRTGLGPGTILCRIRKAKGQRATARRSLRLPFWWRDCNIERRGGSGDGG